MLGLDYGSKTVGVAVSDPLGLTAQGLEIVRRVNEDDVKKSLDRLAEIIEEYEVTKIVLGFPKNMNNTQGERCEKTLVFKARLEKKFKNMPVALWDERLSTMGADRALETLSKKKRDGVIDKMAAVFILQGYLDSGAEKKEV